MSQATAGNFSDADEIQTVAPRFRDGVSGGPIGQIRSSALKMSLSQAVPITAPV